MKSICHLWKITTIIGVYLWSFWAHALTLDTSLFYLSDSFSATSDTTSTRIFGEFAVTINLDKKGQWVIGWSYNYMSITESGSTTSDFGLTEMGPKLGYYLDKDYIWSIFFTYNFQSKADYSSGSSTAEWRGTSMKGELGFTPAFGENFNAGVKLNYYITNFNEEFTSGTTFSTISNSRSLIYPTIAFIYRFD